MWDRVKWREIGRGQADNKGRKVRREEKSGERQEEKRTTNKSGEKQKKGRATEKSGEKQEERTAATK